MELPYKFIFGWLIFIMVIYSVCGYLYASYEEEAPAVTYTEENLTIFDLAGQVAGWFVNALIALFRVFFFALPEMPAIVTVVINLIIQPFNIIWFLAIYPYIRDIVRVAIEALDAIIPF